MAASSEWRSSCSCGSKSQTVVPRSRLPRLRIAPDSVSRLYQAIDLVVGDEADATVDRCAEIIVHIVDVERLQARSFSRQVKGMDLPPALRPDGVAVEEAREHNHDIGRSLAALQHVGQAAEVADFGFEPGERVLVGDRELAEGHQVPRKNLADRRHWRTAVAGWWSATQVGKVVLVLATGRRAAAQIGIRHLSATAASDK
jgi:hypothetical protein